MTIQSFIDKYGIKDTEPLKKWWCDGCAWETFAVNFYTLLCFVPLWKFNEMYNAWYAATEGGAMGDFMEATPSEKQINDFMETGVIHEW